MLVPRHVRRSTERHCRSGAIRGVERRLVHLDLTRKRRVQCARIMQIGFSHRRSVLFIEQVVHSGDAPAPVSVTNSAFLVRLITTLSRLWRSGNSLVQEPAIAVHSAVHLGASRPLTRR
jgi:hypothetical protein